MSNTNNRWTAIFLVMKEMLKITAQRMFLYIGFQLSSLLLSPKLKILLFLLCEVKKKKKRYIYIKNLFYLNKKEKWGFFSKEFRGERSSVRSAWCHSLHRQGCLCYLIFGLPLPCFLVSSGFRSTSFWKEDRNRDQANSLLQSQYTH